MSDFTTPVIELLVTAKISHRLLPHSEPALTCESAAEQRHVPIDEMIKCLVLLPKAGHRAVIACLPADRRLSFSKVKSALGIKAFSTASADDIKRVTGFTLGSIPPIGLPADLDLIADTSLLKKKQVNISSGDPMCGIELSAWDFRKLFKGRFLDLAE